MRNNGGASRYRSIYDVGRRSQDDGRKTGGKKANGRKKIKQQQQQPLVAIRGRLAIDAAAASERGGVKEGI